MVGPTVLPGWMAVMHRNMALQAACRKVFCNRVVLVSVYLGQAIIIWQKVWLMGSLQIQLWAQTVPMLLIHGTCSTVISQYAFQTTSAEPVIWGNKESQGQQPDCFSCTCSNTFIENVVYVMSVLNAGVTKRTKRESLYSRSSWCAGESNLYSQLNFIVEEPQRLWGLLKPNYLPKLKWNAVFASSILMLFTPN